jgi:hypothetical protein
MADARGVIDVVRAEEPRRFLRDVVDFVRDAARREIERDPARIGSAKARAMRL